MLWFTDADVNMPTICYMVTESLYVVMPFALLKFYFDFVICQQILMLLSANLI
jgi:hypothetical protein